MIYIWCKYLYTSFFKNRENYYLFYTTKKYWIKPGNLCPHPHLLLRHISEKRMPLANTPFFLLVYNADVSNY